MLVGVRLRELRISKNLSQRDIQKRTKLLRCYVSRVENGHTIPSVETLEKWANALGISLYQLFYTEKSSRRPKVSKVKDDRLWGCSGQDARTLNRFCDLFSRMDDQSQDFIMSIAMHIVRRSKSAPHAN
jgi:transcriptional regulator with XRE-family HTH domain